MIDDPLGFTLKLALRTRYSTKRYLEDLIANNNVNDCQIELEN